MKPETRSQMQYSPVRLLITIIASIFLAEVIAMLVVYVIQPTPYHLVTLIDAGIMTILIFPVLYLLSFRPLLRHIETSRQSEESLMQSRQLQERFFNSIDTLIAYMDRDFNFVHVNDAYARADGRLPEDFLGKNHFELYPNEENQAIFQHVVATGEVFRVYEKPFAYSEHPERGLKYWDWSVQPVKGSDGAVVGMVLSLMDVTERKRAQDVIRQLSRIVEQTEDTVVVTDCNGVINYVNPAFERLTGYTKEEALGKNPRILKSGLHNIFFYQKLWNTILNGTVFQGEIANRKRDGEVFYEVKTITPLRDAQGKITSFVATGKDITEHKHDEEQLQKAYDNLELRVQKRTEELRNTNIELEAEIFERQRAEAALRESEKRSNRAEEIAHLGSWELDLIDNRLIWSDEVYRIFGLQPQEFEPSYEAFLEAVHPEDRAAVDSTYVSSVREGKDGYEIEHRVIRRSSSEVRVVHEKCDHLRNDTGQVIRSMGMVHDITERKQAEEELRLAKDRLEVRVQERTEELAIANQELMKEISERKEIERKLRIRTTAMESAANGIVITDVKGTIQWTNPAFVQISGYEVHDLLGQSMHIFRSGRHDESFYRQMWGTILSGQVWRGEITNRRKDGSTYVEEQTITPVRDHEGQITHFIAIKQDITERKRGEQAVRESEEKFRTLVDWTYGWEIWMDPSGQIVYCSPSCERITGYSPEEFKSTPDLMTRIVHPDDQFRYQEHQRVLHDETADVQTMEHRIVARDGRLRWIEHVCRPLFGSDNQYLGRRMSNRDITEQKQAEREIEERNQKERILTQTIHTMQLDIARDLHDTIGQNISFLRMKLDHLAERKIRKQSQIQLEIQNMARAANESYDLMRGTLAVLQSTNSTDLFRLFTRYAEQIEERSNLKVSSLNRGEPRFMSAKRLRQLFYIFREILNNIEKHSNATQVSMEMIWEPDYLSLVVCDDGSGFDMDKIQYGGHYGLKFMKERAEILNGSLIIRSAAGSGTVVTLRVPYE
ncbi:MAG TPA: PAS domain S-box protein [Anaerolineales bacterium]|nr:PAS domain S-box protein [Anaerolineales bacterium]